MSRYWTRIGLGALLIFVVGFGGLALVRKGSAEVKSFLASTARRLPLRLANLGFTLEGRRVGEITSIEINRQAASDPGRVTAQVRLSDPAAAAALASCALSLDDSRHDFRKSTFYCAGEDAVQSGSLVEVGEVTFQPGSFTRPLYLPERAVAEWQQSGILALQASLRQDGHGGVRASGSFDLRDRNDGPRRGSFDLRADSQGTLFTVRDEDHRALIDLRADQAGLSLRISDRHGRGLFRMIADSLGAALRAHK